MKNNFPHGKHSLMISSPIWAWSWRMSSRSPKIRFLVARMLLFAHLNIPTNLWRTRERRGRKNRELGAHGDSIGFNSRSWSLSTPKCNEKHILSLLTPISRGGTQSGTLLITQHFPIVGFDPQPILWPNRIDFYRSPLIARWSHSPLDSPYGWLPACYRNQLALIKCDNWRYWVAPERSFKWENSRGMSFFKNVYQIAKQRKREQSVLARRLITFHPSLDFDMKTSFAPNSFPLRAAKNRNDQPKA